MRAHSIIAHSPWRLGQWKLSNCIIHPDPVLNKIGYLPIHFFIRPDGGLTLETPALETLYGGQLTLSTQLIKLNRLVILLIDYNFFRKLSLLFICSLVHYFVRLLLHLFTFSFLYPFIHSPVHLFFFSVFHPFICLCVLFFTGSFIYVIYIDVFWMSGIYKLQLTFWNRNVMLFFRRGCLSAKPNFHLFQGGRWDAQLLSFVLVCLPCHTSQVGYSAKIWR